jgi:hypothetical protein
MESEAKKCADELCGKTVRAGEKYCGVHRRKVLYEMKKAGYLPTELPPIGLPPKGRGQDAREELSETKRGLRYQ